MTHYKMELHLAKELVKVATEITEWFRKEGFESFQKKDDTPVTLADYASQLFIINQIREEFPNDQLIAEESFSSFINKSAQKAIAKCYDSLELQLPTQIEKVLNYRGSLSPRQWTIDPIDGTKGFQENLSYAVGIGFMIDSVLMVAAIGIPNYNTSETAIFIAEKNQGTKISYEGINYINTHVSNTKEIMQAKMCHSLHYDKPWEMEFAKEAKIKNFIQIDSMAKFCMIADGTADIYIKPMDKARSFSWDFLPGALIVKEAGGIVSDLNGNDLVFEKEKCLITAPGLIASNAFLHEQVLKYFKKHQIST